MAIDKSNKKLSLKQIITEIHWGMISFVSLSIALLFSLLWQKKNNE
jgi:hypothetical protein